MSAMQDLLIYIHGFNSGGGSDKATFLGEKLPEFELFSPYLPYAPDAAIALLTEAIESALDSDRQVMLVGASLGGFYALCLGHRFSLPVVMINPLVDQTLLRHEIGPQQNYYTGKKYEWTETHCQQLDSMVVAPDAMPVRPLLLVDAGDELLDSRMAVEHFGEYAESHLFPGGNHRFAHMPDALPRIVDYLDRHISSGNTRP